MHIINYGHISGMKTVKKIQYMAKHRLIQTIRVKKLNNSFHLDYQYDNVNIKFQCNLIILISS